MPKLNIFEVLKLIDVGFKPAWDEFTDTERKEVTFFTLNRWLSVIKNGSNAEQEHYVHFTNELLNKHFYTINKHPKLLWLLCCMISYNNKTKLHEWIAHKKKLSSSNKKVQFLEKLYPLYKPDEIELLLKVNTDEQLKQLARDCGYDEKQIKELMK